MLELEFALPFAVSLVVLGACERILNAFLSLFLSDTPSLKRAAARQLLGQIVQSIASAGSVATRAAAKTGLGLLRWYAFFIALFLVLGLMYVTYEEYPFVWTETVRWYNESIGGWLHEAVVIPLQVCPYFACFCALGPAILTRFDLAYLQIVEILVRALVPLWNSAWWYLQALWRQGVFPIMLREINTVLKAASAVGQLGVDLAMALKDFVGSFQCQGLACLQPDLRVFNLLPVMGSVRQLAALASVFLQNVCGSLAVPVDLAVYPLLDINLAQGCHYLWNSVLQLLFVIPQATSVRCAEFAPGTNFRLLLCTPDFEPFFDYLVAGLTSLGLALDNYANIALVIVQRSLTGTAPSCDSAVDQFIPDLLSGLFAAPTVTVGLTEWLYAVTDGATAMYQGSGGVAVVRAWPYPVDVGNGVAAVAYGRANELDASTLSGAGATRGSAQTTGMLGCNCTDLAAGGIAVACAILPMAGAVGDPAKYLLQGIFPDDQVAGYLVCAGVHLYVRSVRWPFSHYSSDASAGASTDCISRGSCREADATVWLVPRCSSPLNHPLACATPACYPFCMAARESGSANNNLIFAGAERWRSGVALMQQDCAGVATSNPGGTQASLGSAGASAHVAGGSNLLGAGSLGAFVRAASSPRCTPAAPITSFVDKPAGASRDLAAVGQPFAITGDTIMTQVDLGGGSYAVAVERLSGDQRNVFSLVPVNERLPAVAPPDVPADLRVQQTTEAVRFNFGYTSTMPQPVVSTAARDYVLYAVNPTLDAYSPYLTYCSRDPDLGQLPQFGYLFQQSYAGVWLYRVRAYARCSASSCPPGLSRGVELPGLRAKFTKDCEQNFTVGVAALEYLNPDNVAVRLLVSSVRNWDVPTQSFAGSLTRYVTVWLNPATMQVFQPPPACASTHCLTPRPVGG